MKASSSLGGGSGGGGLPVGEPGQRRRERERQARADQTMGTGILRGRAGRPGRSRRRPGGAGSVRTRGAGPKSSITRPRMLKRRLECRRIDANAQPGPFEGRRRADRHVAAAAPPRLVRRQRLRGADLRGRLAPAAPAGRRLLGGLARRPAGHVHGRHVPRQPAPAALRLAARASAAGLRLSRDRHRASSASLVLYGVPLVGSLYAASVATGFRASCCAALLCAACLLPPTMLMGATLPAIARWIETDRRRRLVARASSTAPTSPARSAAACWPASTCCASTTWPPRRSSRSRSTWRRSARRCGSRRRPATPTRRTRRRPCASTSRASGGAPIYVAIALSGLCALGAEVVWTRLLSLMLGATTYTFSIILAVFLIGLGIGSSLGSVLAARARRRGRAGRLPGCLPAGDRLDGGHARRLAAVLADQPVAVDQPLVPFQLDFARCALGAAAGDDPLGRELPAGARRGRRTESGSRPAGRRRLRRQHGRRDRRRGARSAW